MKLFRRFLAVLLTVCMVLTSQAATLWASVVPQDAQEVSLDSVLAEGEVSEGMEENLTEEKTQTDVSTPESVNETGGGLLLGGLLEEGTEEELVGAGIVPLSDISSSITVEPTSQTAVTNIARDGSFGLYVSYTVDDSRLSTAKANLTWTYDLSSLAASSPISDLSGSGYLYDGNTEAGTFTVTDNIVYLNINDAYIREKEKGVSGTFSLNLNLDADEVGTADHIDLVFPGGSTVTPTFKPVSLGSYKTVNNSTESGGKTMTLTPNGDGSYTLNYYIECQPDATLDQLSLLDTMDGKQSLDAGSFSIQYNYQNFDATPAISGNSFSFDVVQALGHSVKKNDKIAISYTSTIAAADIGNLESNTATWNWEGDPLTNKTSVTTAKKVKVDKDVVDNGDETYTYTITIGDSTDNLAGFYVKDTMTDNQIPQGDISVSPAISGVSVTGSSSFQDEEYSNDSSTFFDFTFPDGTYMGPYKISYTVTHKPSVKDPVQMSNNTNISKGDISSGDDASITYTPELNDSISPTKTFTGWNSENHTATWSVTIDNTDETTWPLTNVVITDNDAHYDIDASGYGYYSDGVGPAAMEIDLSGITIQTTAGGTQLVKDTDYTVSGTAISLPSISEAITISGIVTNIPVDFTGDLWAQNKIKVEADKQKDKEFEQKERYSDGSGPKFMDKKGEYDKETKTFNWTVTINPNQEPVESDAVVYFADKLPENQTLVGSTINIASSGGFWKTVDVAVSAEDGAIQPIAITGEESIASVWSDQWNYLKTLSGNKVVITYSTKFTEAGLEEFNSVETLNVSNTAYLYDNPDVIPGEGTATDEGPVSFEVGHEYVNKKDTSPNPLTDDTVTYHIDVNPEGLRLNNGEPIILTDTIATHLNLILGSVTVTGTDDPGLSYNDDTRILRVVVPDETPCVVTFNVRSETLGNIDFGNQCTLTAGGRSWDSATSEKHNVIKHAGTVQGTADVIYLKKYDEYNIKKTLTGAEFDLYKFDIDDEGNITNPNVQPFKHITCNEYGTATLDELEPYTLYAWKETKAPDGYVVGSEELHNFVMYPIAWASKYEVDESATNANRLIAKEIDDKAQTANGIIVNTIKDTSDWIVTNTKESISSVKTSIGGSKKVIGADMAAGEEFEFVLEAADESTPMPEAADATDETEAVTVEGTKAATKVKGTIAADESKEFSFGEITFNGEGTYTYKVTEKKPDNPDERIVYDETEYTVTVTVARNVATNSLETQTTITKPNPDSDDPATVEVDKIEFENEYIIPDGPATTDLTVAKVWVDENNAAGKRPASLTVELYANGAATGKTVTLNEGKSWTDTLTDLPVTDDSENAIAYTWKEDELPAGYTLTDTSVDGTTTTLTNTYEAPTTTVKARKVWVDDSADTRVTVTLHLMKQVGTGEPALVEGQDKTIAADATGEALTVEWTDLPLTEEDKDVTYTVTEEPITDYDSVITGDAETGFTVTNTYNKQETSAVLSVTKEVKGLYEGDENFTFKLAKVDSTTSDVIANDTAEAANGAVAEFAPITYTEVGDYYYSITEQPGETVGMIYDTAAKYAKVHVEIKEGALTATSVRYGDSIEDTEENLLDKLVEFFTGGEESLTVTNTYSVVKISKVDVATSGELKGAVLRVTQKKDAGGADVDAGSAFTETWTSGETTHEIYGLKDGEYELKEDQAPLGYAVAETITFVIKDGLVTGHDGNTIVMSDELNKTNIKISKVDVTNGGAELADAQLTVTMIKDAAGEAVDAAAAFTESWTSGTAPHEIEGLADGTYTLTEESAPDGYKKAETITFVIKDGALVEDANCADGVVTMEDEQYKGGVSVRKQILGQGTELKGASLTVTKKGETEPVASWVSGDTQHEITDLADGTYVLTETSAPAGFEKAESIEFTIENGQLVEGENAAGGVVTMQDKQYTTDVRISKVDVADGVTELAGATLTVVRTKDAAGEAVSETGISWVSDGNTHTVSGLVDGTYTLTEESAPNGYKKAESIEFVIKNGALVTEGNGAIVDGIVKMADEQYKTDVKISKVDAADGVTELPGATLSVVRTKDASGNDVTEDGISWVSDGSTHTVENLLDGTYTLTEESAPDGYKKAETITFVIKDGALVTEGNDAISDGVVKMADEQNKTDVQISKVDAADGVTELPGATLTVARIKDASGKDVTEEGISWESDGTTHTVTGLLDGTYTLTEESAPEGYKKAETITFVIKDGALVTEGNDAIVDGVVKMADEQYKGGVTISKVALGQGKELVGADLKVTQIADAAGTAVSKEIASWKSDGTQKELTDLEDGTYVLTETSAPEGYEVAESIEFTIQGGSLVNNGDKVKDGVVTMSDEMKKTSVAVSKVAAGAGNELAGATLTVTRIIDIEGTVVNTEVARWESNGSVHTVEGLTDGTYRLTEESAPDGYKKAESIDFVIKDGALVTEGNDAIVDGVVKMADEQNKTDVQISKVDAADGVTELPGATLTVTRIKDASGKDVTEEGISWESDGTTHTVTGLLDGTYTLTEESAPEGYKKAETITFVIKDGALVTEGNDAIVDGVVKMADEQYKGGVTISKVALGQGKELVGADLKVTQIADAAGTAVSKEIASWKSDGTQKELTDLEDGTYVLTETSAPEGYEVAESIEFTIQGGSLVSDGDKVKDGVVTMSDEMKKTNVDVSKVAAGAGNELAGATLTVTRIIDIDGTVVNTEVARWESNGSVHTVEGLTDGRYRLTEESAPDGYKKAESIEFVIKNGALVTEGNNAIEDGVVKMADEQYKTDVKISKVDAGAGNEMVGADLKVTRIANAAGETVNESVDSWTSNGSVHEIAGLTDGTYTLTETSAPEGYEVAESITFVIKNGELAEDANAKAGVVTMKDEQNTVDVQISKVAAGAGTELAGATLTITKEGQEKPVTSWISDGSIHTVAGLTDGIYTLTEESAPDGYKKAESITFTIKDGALVTEGNEAIVDGVVKMADEQYKGGVSISKVALGQGKELVGADLTVTQIKDAAGTTVSKEIASWKSDGKQKELTDLADGTYVLTETSAPEGYEVAESIEFTIKDGKLVDGENAQGGVVTMLDALKKTDVKISKVAVGGGKELVGATLTIRRTLDIDGNEVNDLIQTWESEGSIHEVAGLTDGTYTLTEESAPAGYKVAESITFVIKNGALVEDANAKDGIVTMKDELFKTDVKISKVDAGQGNELVGADLSVKRIADASGKEVSEDVESWKSNGSAHEVVGLTDGTYTLTEESAPNGYKVAESITFKIKNGKLVEDANAKDGVVTMKDEQNTVDVQISKVAAGAGTELGGATLTITKEGQEKPVTSWISDGSIHTVAGLTDGIYTLTEESAPDGYKKAESITFTIKDGKLVEDAHAKDGVVTMTDELYKGGVSISKVALGQGKELVGADLTVTQIKDAQGAAVSKEIASWKSDGKQKELTDLEDGTYVLTETSAPEGYEVAESIEFTINDGKLVDSENAQGGVVTMQDALKKTDVKISKVAVGGGNELVGAMLTIRRTLDIDGNEADDLIQSWESNGSIHEVTGLTDGTYTLTEESAPEGYKVAESITFVIKDGKLVEDDNAKNGIVTMKDEQKKTDVQISKVAVGQGGELVGAALILTKEGQEETVDKWKSNGSVHVVKDLTDGVYTLTELSAPDGYQKAESITFVIKNGKLVEEGNDAIVNGVVTMKDEQYKGGVSVSKQALGQGTELKGAVLSVTKKGETKAIESWTSNGTLHEIADLADGTYILTETSAPEGYEVAESIEFTIKDGKLVEGSNAKDGVVTMKDALKKTDVKISKVAVGGGKELVGATLTVTRTLDIDGNKVNDLIATWESEGSIHEVTGLTDGTYTLTEESAPAGYKVAESLTFVIKDGALAHDANAENGIVTMKDEQFKTDVKISKVDAGQGNELTGADLTVTKIADAAGTTVSEEVTSWTSDGSVHEVAGLTDGTYTLTETSAPEGYEVSESITFVIKDGKLVEDANAKAGVVTMKDEQKKTDVQISKVDAGAGNELAGAILTLTKEGQEKPVESWESDGSIHTVAGLTDGIYTLTEESAPDGYKKAESITFTIKDGKLVEEGNDAIVDGVVKMADEQYKGGVSISKVALGQGKELVGADLTVTQIKDAAGETVNKEIASWKSDGKQKELTDLEDGTYVLTETSAPEGYEVAENIEFTVKDGKLVDGENAQGGVVTMKDALKKTDVKISKVDAGQGSELTGAQLTVTRTVNIAGEKVNELVETWKSDGKVHEIVGLTDGTYTLVEESAPNSYKVAESITFVIKDGKLVEDDNAKDGIVTMKDEQNKVDVQINKVDAGAGTELQGATLTVEQIADASGTEVSKTVASWTSNGSIHTVAGLADGTYKLTEESAPDGYKKAESITFTIKNGALVTEGNDAIEDGVVKMADEQYKTDVQISKVDAGAGTELAGATLTLERIADASGKEVSTQIEKWKSDGSIHTVAGLTDGTYKLTEESAPDGYKKAESITFVIKNGALVAEGNSAIVDGVVTMKDEQYKGGVSISKTVLGQGTELKGAELTVTRIKDADGTEVKESIAGWTSDGTRHEIADLEDGTYVLTETSAPEGYEVAESIEFIIRDGKLVDGANAKDGVVTMQDALKKTDVKVSKVDAGAGTELVGAVLTVTRVVNIEGKEVSESVDSWTSNGSVHEIAGLTDGTYTLTESSAPLGYEVAETITFVIKNGALVEDENAVGGTVTMRDELKKTDVQISKVDAGAGTELVGAILTLTKEGQETPVESWESDGGIHTVAGLTDGIYTLTEESAPDGYKKAESITFTIKDGALVTEGNDAIVDGVVKMADEQYKGGVSISKEVLGQGKELVGADLTVTQIKDAAGVTVSKEVASWKSDGKQKELTDLGDGTYVLTETSAPEGYEVAESIEFTIKDGKLVDGENAQGGVVTMQDALKKTDVKISKVAVGGGKELVGATLTITRTLDIDGNEADDLIQTWESDGNIHEVAGLTDGTYTLTEESAPAGYKVAESITFVIKNGALIEDANAKDGIVTMKDELFKTDVKISKVDAGQGNELTGADLTVTKIADAAGTTVSEEVTSWTSDGSVHEVAGLTDGTYLLVEESAPFGYKVAESITFVIRNGKLAEDANAVNGVVTMKDEQYKTDVKISKVDAGAGNELAGATLTITKEGQEKPVTSWISDGSIHTVAGLTDGTYTLVEESAPDGYKKAESITFTIKNGALVTEGNDAIVDGVVKMADEQYKGGVSISKEALGQGTELAGADLTVRKIADASGKKVDEHVESWTSNGKQYELMDLADGTYVLTETSAPEGYEVAESIEFTIKEGKLVDGENAQGGVVTMQDALKKTDVKISKVDAGAGNELVGATLTVTRIAEIDGSEANDLIETWTSNGSVHEIAGLTDGTYTLTEESAPDGYKKAETITFVIKDGKLVAGENAADGTVTMKDEQNKTNVQISKVDAGAGNELVGADLTVKRIADATGKAVSEDIESWKSDGSVHTIANLQDGTYTLTEESAPLGYEVAESITFVIKDGKLAEDANAKDGVVTMKDELLKTDVQISKVAVGAGNELKGANLTVTRTKDVSGKTVSEKVARWTSDGSIHTVTGLTDGTYVLTEESAPEGYMVSESITFTIENGELVEDANVKDGVVTMKDELYKTDVTISKVDAGQGTELVGATLTVKRVAKADGTAVDETVEVWTSNGSVHEVKGLTDGTYTLTEESAPLGYNVAESITFVIKDGALVEDENAAGGVVTMKDAQKTLDVQISKVDAGQGNELAGAVLTITKEGQEKPVESWTSDGTVHVVAGLTDGTYTLVEDSAPLGYKKAESITFTILDGKIVSGDSDGDGVITMLDEQYIGGVSISKEVLGQGSELAGADLTVTRIEKADGTSVNEHVESWTSDGSQHEVMDLTDGAYVLSETSAPEGYEVTESITFWMREGKLVEDGVYAVSGVVTMKDAQKKLDVKISKVDAGQGNELKGAKLTVAKLVTVEGTEVTIPVESWTSDGSVHTVAGLVDGTYTLTEESAPKGYKVAESITFTIKDGKLVEDDNVKEGTVTMKDAQYETDVKISKVDAGQGSELVGATLTVTKVAEADGTAVNKEIESWTSNGSVHEVAGLTDGTYTLTEESAPKGYKVAESITFTIVNGELVKSADVKDGVVTMKDAQYETDVKISKVDAGQGNELAGADLTITKTADANGNSVTEVVVASWKSDGSVHEVAGLTDGTYTLTEESAPDGYKKAESITFVIENGELKADDNVKDGVITMKDEQYVGGVSISKEVLGQGKELAGAKLTVTLKSGTNPIESWTSDGKQHEIKELKDGTYILREISAPNGYEVAESITFTMKDGKLVEDENAKNGVVTMFDKQYTTDVKISKVDAGAGNELKGATLTVTRVADADGKEVTEFVAEWLSDGSVHEVAGLTDGTYTLTEESAPNGYKVAESITFEIRNGEIVKSADAENGVVTMKDEQYKTDVTISKVDAGQGKELKGATLTVRKIADADGKETSEEIASWTSTGETHEVAGLTDGTYTLTEESAPDGYAVAETITFVIKDGKLVEDANAANGIVTMKDELLKTDVQISKKAVGQGNELSGAELSVDRVTTVDGQTTMERIDSWTSNGSVHTITGLTDGTYVLTETSAPDGYEVAESITFEIKGGKLVESESAKNGVVTMLDKQITVETVDVKISLVDKNTREPITGAELSVVDEDGEVVETWTSTEEPHEVKDLEVGKTYKLRVGNIPGGYKLFSSFDFTANADGTIETDVPMEDDGSFPAEAVKTVVRVSKVDVADGKEVEGATIQILNADGEVVQLGSEKLEWTSTTEPKVIEGLDTGVTYTLHEEVAPEGYLTATDTTFTIDVDGKITSTGSVTTDKDGNTVLLVEDKKKPETTATVRVSKTDIATGAEVAGATIQILDKNGEVVEEWTSEATGTAHVIEGLKIGETYTLKETVAPVGYGIASETTFKIGEDGGVVYKGNTKIDADGNKVMLVEDTAISFNVNKVAAGTGDELEGATLKVYEMTVEGMVKAATDGTAIVIDSWTSKKGETHDFGSKLEAGKTYYLVETVAPTGYKVMTTVKVVVAEDGTITTSLGKTTLEDGTVVYLVENSLKATATPTTKATTTPRAVITRRAASSTSASTTRSTTGTTTSKSSTTARTTGAKTADETPVEMYFLLMVAAGAVIVAMRRRERSGR